MPDRATVSVVLICLDEEARLARALESVRWADEVVVLDGGSRDRTRDIAAAFGAKVQERPFTDFATQHNSALELATCDWILSLDADEVVTPELALEIRALLASGPRCRGYEIPFKNFLGQRWLRHGGLSPDPHLRLFQRGRGRFAGAIHERLQIDGPIGRLTAPIEHYTYRDIAHVREKVHRYAPLEARERARAGERLRRLAAKVPYRFLKAYILQAGFLDGRAGLLHACELTRYAYIVLREVRWLRAMPAAPALPAACLGEAAHAPRRADSRMPPLPAAERAPAAGAPEQER